MHHTRRRAAAVLTGLTLAVTTLLTGTPASAAVDDFTFDSLHADFYLDRDEGGHATLRTVETFVAQFPDFDQNRGILRAIPSTYGEVDLKVTITGVFDENGRPHPYSVSDDGGFTVVRIGDPSSYVHGQVTYVIEYTSRDVVRSFDDTWAGTSTDEFYWDVNGTGWAQPFGVVSATVHLSPEHQQALTGNAACYYGYSGSTDQCAITRTGNGFEASVSNLERYQTLTFAVGFHPGTFAEPFILREHWAFNLLPLVLLGASAMLWLFALAYRVIAWRDHPGRGIIIPQYTPHDDAYPALAAHLLDKKKAALPAQLIDYTVRDVVKLRENLNTPSDNRWELELLVDPYAVDTEHDDILTSIFNTTKSGRRITLNASDRKLGDRLAALDKTLEKRLSSRGWVIKPQPGPSRPAARMGAWIVVALIALWAYALFAEVDNWLLWVAPWAAFFLWLFTSSAATPPYVMSEKGAEVRDHLLGIRDYLKLAEADRIRMLQAPDTAERIDVTDRQAVVKLFEKLLPYAVIFNVERQWLRELGRDYETLGTPEWARGTHTLYSINTFSHSVATTRFAVTPPPSSSGSSWSSSGGSSFSGGSSGGGSSGGGGGGGGGGGW
ncbi:MAG TPA: DUF2207 domain-containing protein [Terrimesophilobacter sp.]|nr:DUF2207 domain-containing protein [Terrimesophilobacter sp.]